MSSPPLSIKILARIPDIVALLMRRLDSVVSKGSSCSQREMLYGDSVILGVIGTGVLPDGMCLGSIVVVVLSSSGGLGTLSLCVL